MITARQAAEVAKAHGLSLSDAAALSRMAETADEAELLAGMWGAPAADPAATTKRINDNIRRGANRNRGTIKVADTDQEGR